jgi:hypothetical protein
VLVLLWPARASAQGDARFAADRFEPSERGSEWFANESLNLRGPAPIRMGVVSSYGERLFVVRDASGKAIGAPLRNDEVLHVGASAFVLSFLRLGVDLPLQLITAGRTTRGIRSPDHEQGFGDLRLGADVRVYGRDRDPLRVAMGAQVWAPTGEQSQWASDDAWRIRPRMVVAGERGKGVWSAQVGVNFRDDRIGTDVGLSGAAGIRLFEQWVIGPELIMSTNLTKGAFERATTPFEMMMGTHWLIARTIRIGVGLGRGFLQSATDPNYRITGMFEYAPEFAPRRRRPPTPPVSPLTPPKPPVDDTDHDRIPDDQDACPAVAGIPATDASQNGCPPDTDGDNINDLGDACPTQPGPATEDPTTTGCPQP